MTLPHNALVLVADGRKMLFLRNHGDDTLIDLRTEAHKSDAPGTMQQSAGYSRPAMDETDFHQQEEERWAKKAAKASPTSTRRSATATSSPASRSSRASN